MPHLRFAPLDSAGEGRELRGVLVRYGDVATLGSRRERIRAGAFSPLPSTLTLTVQHRRDRIISRTGAGLEVEDSADALRLRAVLSEDVLEAAAALASVRAGLLTGLSVEMIITRERRQPDGIITIDRAALVGLSLVDTPAYPSSAAELRELETAGLRERRRRIVL